MKSYLSLIPISARRRRRQNRMTLLCIIFAVFLVTAIFSVADMGVRMEQARLTEKHAQDFSFGAIMDTSMGQTLFLSGVGLFVLILLAGVLMISGSINSTVAQRTKFFGMMRCIGMSRQQLKRFVRLEALNWCKTAIPIGVVLGTVCTWVLCAILRFVVKEEFTAIPLFGISPIGIISGVVMGLVTVLLAARAPAKQAAKVSPMAAVSGNTENTSRVRRPVRVGVLPIEISLGTHHAMSARKNLILMTGSFALSIILFLTFSVLLDFVGYLLPQSVAAADITITDEAGVTGINCISPETVETIRGMDGVKNIFGRRSIFDVPAELGQEGLPRVVDLFSFDDFDLTALKKDGRLRKGSDLSKVYGDNGSVLVICDPDAPLRKGDTIRVDGQALSIAGLLKHDLFSEDGLSHGRVSIIASSETFVRLTGVTDYSTVMVQTAGDVTDGDVAAISGVLDEGTALRDEREGRTSGTYTAFVLCVYGFLAIIAMVTLLNIMNSISMSVSAKSRQYGAMRAVGMEGGQVTKMIAAEAVTYALAGCVIGCVVGLVLGRMLYSLLIDGRFPYAVWTIPVSRLLIVVVFVAAATLAAIHAPAKRMREMAVTETINEL
nr:FtsX-like permease family protein [uncultured Oscillibacter sp.]